MRHRMLHGKIHRARVTEANIDYVGSISIDSTLMSRAGIHAHEQVAVYNLNNGERFETYAIEGSPGQICLNGAAARLAHVGDRVIIVTFVDLEPEELADHEPTVVVVDDQNRPVEHLRLADDGVTSQA
jgi:aspartate 1-decarboxylase